MGLLGDIAIPAILGLLIVGVLFLLKGFLSFVIGVPLWIIISVVVMALVLFFIPTNILMSFYRYGREGFTFMQARKDGVPVICDVEIGTSNAEFILGLKNNPKDPLFKDEQSGVKVDPSLISAYAEPLRFSGGLNIIGYGHHNWLPQTARNHLAFKAIVDYFQTEPMKELMFLTDKEKIELISKPEHFLEADLKTKVGKYFKTRKDGEGKDAKTIYYRQFQKDGIWYEQEINIPEIINLIQKAKSDITKLPIATGYFSMNEAFKYNNVPYSAQHLSQLKNLLKQLVDEQWMKMMNWMQYGMIICAIMGMTILGIYILHTVVFKAA
jgi:hypothetical protein